MEEQAPVFHLVLPLTPLRVTYETTQAGFLHVAQRAADSIKHGSGCHWFVDGHTSDTLFLRLSRESLGLGLSCLNEEISLQMGPGTVTISVLSRLPSVHDVFHQFAQQLGLYLPCKAA